MVAQTCNASTKEVEAAGAGVQEQLQLYKLITYLGTTEEPDIATGQNLQQLRFSLCLWVAWVI